MTRHYSTEKAGTYFIQLRDKSLDKETWSDSTFHRVTILLIISAANNYAQNYQILCVLKGLHLTSFANHNIIL